MQRCANYHGQNVLNICPHLIRSNINETITVYFPNYYKNYNEILSSLRIINLLYKYKGVIQ